MIREAKKHWRARKPRTAGKAAYTLCGIIGRFANKERGVTCKTCARIIAGYQTEEK